MKLLWKWSGREEERAGLVEGKRGEEMEKIRAGERNRRTMSIAEQEETSEVKCRRGGRKIGRGVVQGRGRKRGCRFSGGQEGGKEAVDVVQGEEKEGPI